MLMHDLPAWRQIDFPSARREAKHHQQTAQQQEQPQQRGGGGKRKRTSGPPQLVTEARGERAQAMLDQKRQKEEEQLRQQAEFKVGDNCDLVRGTVVSTRAESSHGPCPDPTYHRYLLMVVNPTSSTVRYDWDRVAGMPPTCSCWPRPGRASLRAYLRDVKSYRDFSY